MKPGRRYLAGKAAERQDWKTNNSDRLNRTATILVAALFCVSCSGPAQKVAGAKTDDDGAAGIYSFSMPDLKLDLVLRPDRTYYASIESWGREQLETGTWKTESGDVVLKTDGQELDLRMHRLRPAYEGAGESLRIVDPDSPTWVTGTIVFQRANR